MTLCSRFNCILYIFPYVSLSYTFALNFWFLYLFYVAYSSFCFLSYCCLTLCQIKILGSSSVNFCLLCLHVNNTKTRINVIYRVYASRKRDCRPVYSRALRPVRRVESLEWIMCHSVWNGKIKEFEDSWALTSAKPEVNTEMSSNYLSEKIWWAKCIIFSL